MQRNMRTRWKQKSSRPYLYSTVGGGSSVHSADAICRKIKMRMTLLWVQKKEVTETRVLLVLAKRDIWYKGGESRQASSTGESQILERAISQNFKFANIKIR